MDFLSVLFLGQPVYMWSIFFAIVAAIMAFDLGLLNKNDHVMGVRESLRLTAFYVTISLLFGVWIYTQMGANSAIDYYTAYVIEQSLSLDNIFVISMIMASYGVPRQYQHRVLFWGIIGVILLRGLIIGFGTAIVHQFSWVLLIFAALLILTAIKMILSKDEEEKSVENNPVIKFLRRKLNVTHEYHGHNFFVRTAHPKTGRLVLFATPLFLALMTVEIADLIFAFDSVPAVLSITTDPFIVFTSNLFAIIGLRALYFALAAMLHRFDYLKYALSIVLFFIGVKVIYQHFPEIQIFGPIHPLVSLAVTVFTLAGGIIYSMAKTKKE